jgi:hypothetical protein
MNDFLIFALLSTHDVVKFFFLLPTESCTVNSILLQDYQCVLPVDNDAVALLSLIEAVVGASAVLVEAVQHG